MSVQAKYFGSDRRCMVHVYTYAKLFGTVSLHINANSKRKFTPPIVLGRNVEDAAIKL